MASSRPAAAPSGDAGLVPSAYADAFVRGPPREGVQRVQTRLHKARILTDELADYFAARRDLEVSYLKALQKVAKRSFLSDPAALGPNFTPVYERLVGEIGEVARIHGDLERRLEQECELPMRNASSQGDWARVKEHDDNLAGTLREIGTLESQLSKDQRKAETASSKKAQQAQDKVQETERSLRTTMDLWDAEAPFAFEAYQRIDAQRLELMKEVVAKFETAQSDAAQRIMSMTEQSMQVALNFDPQVDMQEFVLKSATAKGPASSRQARPSTAQGSARNGLEPGGGRPPAARRISSDATSTLAPGEFGGRAASRRSTDLGQQIDQSTTNSKGGGSTLKSALTRFGRGRSQKKEQDGSAKASTSSSRDMQPPASSSAQLDSQEQLESFDSQIERPDQPDGRGARGAGAAALGAGGAAAARMGASDDIMQPLTPTRKQSTPAQAATTSNAPNLPQIDSEGFSIPPPDRKPWETANASHSPAAVDQNDPMQDVVPKTAGMSIAQEPVQQTSEDQAALERMRSTLLSAGTPGAAPHRRNTTRRDRRDVRNTMFNPMGDGGRPSSTFGLPGSDMGSGVASPSAFTGAPGLGKGRSASMVSTGSAAMSNIGNTTLESVAGQNGTIEPGLRAFINERVNVIMTGREITKVMVVGELSVSAKDLPNTEPLRLRVDAFEQLEKAAANPQFLKETSAGEYTMDVASIARQGGSTAAGRGTVLKYQVHVPLHKASEFVPFQVVPQWRCEAQQTSILINYSANAASKLTSDHGANATLNDIMMSVEVTSSSISNLMSKPPATYAAEQKKLVWRLQDAVPLADGQGGAPPAQKALARFQVDAPSEVRPIDVRWKLPGCSVSSLGVSLVGDASGVQLSSVSRSVVSGKHMASP